MSKITINKDDKERVLLTELLPYEVPILFSNEGFYLNRLHNEAFDDLFSRIIGLSKAPKANDDKNKKYGIPFNYEVVKNSDGDTRELTIIHPNNQLLFNDLYSKYDSLMLNLCSKSPFSLRRINKVAKYYYSPIFIKFEDGDKSSEREVEPDFMNYDSKYLKSYFTYKPIDLIYKFYDSQDYRRLEQRFNYLLELDISKCFYNIYTHSICWAVKDKESSKRNAKMNSFENEFDKLMQLSNYNETNGIIVGPEISRIFAEIILQQIDVNILNSLVEEKLKYGEDYEIKRYVDDYFIFANKESDLEKIKKVCQDELKFYKLYLNPNKTEIKTTPFITDITVGKRELFHFMNGFFGNIIKCEKDNDDKKFYIIEKIRKPYAFSQVFIKDFQCIVKRNNIKYDLISKDVLREIKTQLVKVISSNHNTDISSLENLFLLFLDIAFYSYSLNINANTTFKLSQIIVILSKFLECKDDNIKYNIFSKIIKDSDFVLKNFMRKSKGYSTNIETINLLIALKKIGKDYQFTERKLKEFFGLSDKISYDKLNYFQIVSLLYYIEESDQYKEMKTSLVECVKNKFINDTDPFSKSELTLLFFDFISCPFLGVEHKRSVLKQSRYSKPNDSNEIVDAVINSINKQGKWFMDWDINIDLEKVLKKKDWGSSY